MKFKNYLFEIAAVIVFLAVIAATAVPFARQVSASAHEYKQTVVVIDAGHGDFDPGAVAEDGTKEKTLNLAIALKLADFFKAAGYEVVLTRKDDTTLAASDASSIRKKKSTDTRARAALADSFADAVMISVHQNTFSDSSQHGTQLFYGVKNERSELLADCVMASVVSNLQEDNKRPLKRGTDSIFLLMNVEAPVILIECGFITNEAELALLKDEEYQSRLAYSIFLGYIDYESAVKGDYNAA